MRGTDTVRTVRARSDPPLTRPLQAYCDTCARSAVAAQRAGRPRCRHQPSSRGAGGRVIPTDSAAKKKAEVPTAPIPVIELDDPDQLSAERNRAAGARFPPVFACDKSDLQRWQVGTRGTSGLAPGASWVKICSGIARQLLSPSGCRVAAPTSTARRADPGQRLWGTGPPRRTGTPRGCAS